MGGDPRRALQCRGRSAVRVRWLDSYGLLYAGRISREREPRAQIARRKCLTAGNRVRKRLATKHRRGPGAVCHPWRQGGVTGGGHRASGVKPGRGAACGLSQTDLPRSAPRRPPPPRNLGSSRSLTASPNIFRPKRRFPEPPAPPRALRRPATARRTFRVQAVSGRGVARIRCTNPECGHDHFRPFSCLT